MARKTNTQKIHAGLTIILAREPNTSTSIHSDRIYAGTYCSKQYTATDRADLEALGWYEHEESWAFST